MKNTKRARRAAAFAAAVVMAACAAVPMGSSFSASAASGGSNAITITATDGAAHSYAAYQIFSGTYAGGVLTDITWGDAVDGTAVLTALHNASNNVSSPLNGLFPDTVKDAAGVAKVLSSKTGEGEIKESVFGDDSEKAQAFAAVVGGCLNDSSTKSGTYDSATGKISGLPDGYYLVLDSAAPTNPGETNPNSGAMTRYILKVTAHDNGTPSDITVNAKHSAPSVMKKVLEEGYNTTGDTVKFGNDKDDATAGVQNEYQLEKDYNDVADYSIGDMVPFTLYGSLPDTFGDYEHYYYEFSDTLSKGFVAPAVSDIHVYVDGEDVTTQLGTNAITVADNGDKGIAIAVKITDVKGLTLANGTLSKNSIITVKYSAKLDTDAEIGLDGNVNEVKLTYSNNPNKTGNGTTKPDDTGETPVDKVIVFTYEQDFTKKDADSGKELKDAEFVLSRKKGEETQYLVATQKVNKVDGTYVVDSWTTEKDKATTLKTTDGTYKVIGLEDGAYTVEETKKPNGYNDPVDSTTELTISAETDNGQAWAGEASKALTGLTLTAANDGTNAVSVTLGNEQNKAILSDGIVAADIFNTKGSTLPSTGGIGTTMFYIGGGVLVAGAGVLLITKKRAKKDAE
mgnify:FL=1